MNNILTKTEVLQRLRIKSQTAFIKRRRDLIRCGMFQDGKQWLMTEDSFNKYIDYVKTRNGVGTGYSPLCAFKTRNQRGVK
jgi:hypothetical protein